MNVKGSHQSEETRNKIASSLRGKKRNPHSPETIQKMRGVKLGSKNPYFNRKHTAEWKKQESQSKQGPTNPNWKNGITKDKRVYAQIVHSKRRALKVLAPGSHTIGEWESLKAQYDFTCLACKQKEPEIKLTEDHIVPLSRGGSNNIENIQPLCQSCNSRKHTRIVSYIGEVTWYER